MRLLPTPILVVPLVLRIVLPPVVRTFTLPVVTVLLGLHGCACTEENVGTELSCKEMCNTHIECNSEDADEETDALGRRVALFSSSCCPAQLKNGKFLNWQLANCLARRKRKHRDLVSQCKRQNMCSQGYHSTTFCLLV